MHSVNFFKSSHTVAFKIWIVLAFLLNLVWQISEHYFINVIQFALDLKKWTNWTFLFVLTEICSTVCFGEGNSTASVDTASSINVSLALVWLLTPYWLLLMSGLEHFVRIYSEIYVRIEICWHLFYDTDQKREKWKII